jgi:uncharacterized membrane protein
VISSILITNYQQKGCVISEIIFIVSLIIALSLSFFIKEDLRRQNEEKNKMLSRATMKTQDLQLT